MDEFDIIDIDDSVEGEARKTAARRMFMYSERSLLVADKLDRKYVLFPDLRDVLAALDRAYQLALRVRRPQGILISGPPGSSKTSVSEYFFKHLPPATNIIEGHGALSIRLRSNPCAGAIVSLLLRAVRHPFTTIRNGRLGTMRDIAFEALQQLGTRMVVVDQAHVLAQTARRWRSGKTIMETTASEVLRDLMDETGIALVLLACEGFVGLESIDQSLADRVSVRLTLKHFEDDESWQTFLRNIARGFAEVDLQILLDTELATLTHRAVLGNRRRTKLLLTEAVLVAVDAGASAVQREHLELAFTRISGPASQVVNPYATA